MRTVVGVFKTRAEAEQASAELAPLGIPEHRISILTPQLTEEELATVPTTQGEQRGMVKTLGAVVGGAVGMAGGFGLASVLVPGVGPVIALGIAGGALLGAVGGGTVGGAAEDSIFAGLPEEELFVYEDALRQGRTALIATAETDNQAEAARGALEYSGAESIDRAREMWWVGLRDVEKEKYSAAGGNFEEDEPYFRCGFEAALHSHNRDRSFEQCHHELAARYPDMHARKPFQSGFERGRAYLEEFVNRHSRAHRAARS